MKRLISFLFGIFICTFAYGESLNLEWYVDGQVYQTSTCEIGSNITPPIAPTKYGYTFQEWLIYIPIEYLQSTGTQYIDTGVTVNSNTEIELVVSTSLLHGNAITGDVWNYRTALLIFEKNQVKWHLDNSNGLFADNTTLQQDVPIYIKASNGALQVNEDNYTGNPLSSYNGSGLKIFFNTANGKSQIKLYYLKIYDNGNLIRDFIPVLDAEDVPCLYDKVENKFYYNAVSGQFIAGPVLQ